MKPVCRPCRHYFASAALPAALAASLFAAHREKSAETSGDTVSEHTIAAAPVMGAERPERPEIPASVISMAHITLAHAP